MAAEHCSPVGSSTAAAVAAAASVDFREPLLDQVWIAEPGFGHQPVVYWPVVPSEELAAATALENQVNPPTVPADSRLPSEDLLEDRKAAHHLVVSLVRPDDSPTPCEENKMTIG